MPITPQVAGELYGGLTRPLGGGLRGWQPISPPDANDTRVAAYSTTLRQWILAGLTGVLYTSPDFRTFTSRTVPAGKAFQWAVWSPELNLWVVTSSSGGALRIITSPDGITWTERATPAEAVTGVNWSPELGLFVAVRENVANSALTSPDGITWTTRVTPATPAWRSVAWSPELGLFAICGAGTPGPAINGILTSPDGITWTQRVVASGGWTGITWSPPLGLFVAVGFPIGAGFQFITSSDGITWTGGNLSSEYTAVKLSGIVWSPERRIFVASVFDTTGPNQRYAFYSANGTTWFPSRTPAISKDVNGYAAVAWGNPYFAMPAVGNAAGTFMARSRSGK